MDRHLAESGENVIYAHDLNGNFTFLNRQGERILGYSCEEARRMNIAQIIAPEVAAQVREQILDSATKRIGTVCEIEVVTKDGDRVPLEVSTSIVFRKGEPAEIEGIAIPSRQCEEAPALTPRCLDTEFFYRLWLSE